MDEDVEPEATVQSTEQMPATEAFVRVAASRDGSDKDNGQNLKSEDEEATPLKASFKSKQNNKDNRVNPQNIPIDQKSEPKAEATIEMSATNILDDDRDLGMSIVTGQNQTLLIDEQIIPVSKSNKKNIYPAEKVKMVDMLKDVLGRLPS